MIPVSPMYCIVIVLLTLTNIHADISNEFIDEVANNISEVIIELTKKTTNYHVITDEFERLLKTKKLAVEKIQPRNVLNKFKADIEELFAQKASTLKNIRDKVVQLDKEKDKYTKNATKNYFNVHKINTTDGVSVQVNDEFSDRVKVNMTRSFVQVPANLYMYSRSVLNTTAWTEPLDETFIKNFEESKSKGIEMTFQYYGDNSGVMRLYPGSIIGVDGNAKADLFDCRRRVWYSQAVASPKDIVILIDLSGSMMGSNIGIAKMTASSLINTLGENDFFNVLTVKDEVNYVRPCWKHLIQATKRNKEIMKLALLHIGDANRTIDVNLGIEEAFKVLKSGSQHNGTSSECNRAIMFISDGIETDYVGKDMFEKYNVNKSVRAFAYLVGRKQQNVLKDGLKTMACENRGYFYRIETVGNAWDAVLHYMVVMSRQNKTIRPQDEQPMYSLLIVDGWGEGMIMSISMGIFNEKGVLGVAGTDIRERNLKAKIPYSKIGVFTHFVIIDNNGFVLLHPKLREQKGYLPVHRSILFDHLEIGVDKNLTLKLKNNMIDRKKDGEMIFPIYWTYDNDDKITKINATVYYDPIAETEFSAAMILPNQNLNIFQLIDKTDENLLKRGIEALSRTRDAINVTNDTADYSFKDVRIAQWDFCKKKTVGNSNKQYYKADELKDFLKNNTNNKASLIDLSKCDSDLVRILLATAGVVDSAVKKSWITKVLNNELIESVFVSTQGGYLKYLSHVKDTYEKDFKRIPYFDAPEADPDSTILLSVPYKRVEEHDNSYHEKTCSPLPIYTISAAVRIGEEKILTAVTGMKVYGEPFDQLIRKSSLVAFKKNESKALVTLVLDKNAFIISSNLDNCYVGRFLGKVSGLLVEHFEQNGILEKIIFDNTQDECEAIKDECLHSSANFLLTPFKTIASAGVVLLQTLSSILVQYISVLLPRSQTVSARKKKAPDMVSCSEELKYYLFNIEKVSNITKKTINCSRSCEMNYNLRPIDDTNLLILMVNTTMDCESKCTGYKVKLTPTRRPIGFSDDERIYRRRPKYCFNEAVPGENVLCGNSRNLTPSLLTILLAYLIFDRIRHLLS